MSNSDSFIQEVTDELRRERMTATFRRYGWIGGVVILAIVGGTAYAQWSKAHQTSRAQDFGDAMIEALDTGAPDARREALAEIPATGTQATIRNLILASDPSEDRAATLAALQAVIDDATVEPVWKDLAVLRLSILQGKETALAERRKALESIAVPGRPYRALAAEQLAYLFLEEGKPAEAMAGLNTLITAEDASGALRGRVTQVITALGGTPATPAVPADATTAPAAQSTEAE